ncbi:MAG: dTDP-4-dehydrorhamnose reductase [Intestinibacter sp.]|uniref:dTDP-4-dehydrorhamnose reductase n=1 Tax=Intestinibacter sp. TaxID=1965304 RepID=UPI002A801D8A|nr:dTDP-4-dehydrorhamnose reductase [Intestinibacter sp.]MDY4573484.1 dTDP-4-dehydrorhamnose reductase [Intestinibacter sp.]
MKILITGINGQLGYDLVRVLKEDNHEIIGTTRETMDITDFEKVKQVIEEVNPEMIIHCAAYTAVDKAETEADMCENINVFATENLAKLCSQKDIKFMYFSTDYVFNGQGNSFFNPEDKIEKQLNVYGRTKYEGELAVQKYLDKFFIIRISWVFGVNGNNFIKTMIRLGKEKKSISVVADQIGSPTYTYDLAQLVRSMVNSEKYGIYHATNEGICSWYEFALDIFKKLNIKIDVNPVTSEEYITAAKRPKNSRLSKEKLVQNGFKKLPSWQDALDRYLQELNYL